MAACTFLLRVCSCGRFIPPQPLPYSGGKDRLGVGRSYDPRSAARGPVGLSPMRVQAVLKARTSPLGRKAAESPILGYEDVQSGFERFWSVRRP